jgi:succinate dehydrogenase / fumarate reductase, cytochrome b subunit
VAVSVLPAPKTDAKAPTRTPTQRAKRSRRTTVGLKAIMASTGALLVAFLVVHMIGNLKIFLGAAAFDHYAHWLRTIGEPVLPFSGYLWLQRAVLSVAVIAHIWSATVLAVRSRRARPVRYAHRPAVQASYAARTMRWGGVIVLVFIVWHILDLTTRTVNPVIDPAKAYAALVEGFAPGRWPVTLLYVVAMVMIGFHLRHGIWSALQTLGLTSGATVAASARRARIAKAAALAIAVVLSAGFLIVPLSITFGLVG